MQNFEECKRLIGNNVTELDLQAVDCFVHRNFALFIQSVGHCKVAIKPKHTHPSYMIVVQFDRNGTFFTQTIDLPRNHYVASILSPDIEHEDKETDFPNYYTIMIEKNFFETQFALYQKKLPVFTNTQFALCHDILKILHLFAFETTKNMANADITLDAQTMLLTHWIIRSILGDNYDMRSPSTNEHIGRIQTFIEQHLGENISIPQLAQNANMSTSNFTKLFKKECGMSPKTYLTEMRLTKAKQMLARNDFTITEIAYKCGFSSNAHFTTAFHKANNINPTQYRSQFIQDFE